ncbi:hypothetical protein SDC9_117067 [bioreactor metagenome]|uniref:Uncharacterized protein n=1 Tax=bioreactor metagenome TaxID=1076179 RepID=A0A645BXZ0_9ZZZZ
MAFHAFLDGGGDGLAGFLAQARLFVHQDDDAAQAAHFVGAVADGKRDAQLFEQQGLHVAHVVKRAEILQPLQQALFLVAR